MAKNIFLEATIRIMKRLNTADLLQGISRLVADRVGKSEPAKAMPFLLELDNLIYSLSGPTASRLENGVHPKHRLTRYHDFFVSRLKPGERVLDVGCGYGAVAWDLAKRAKVKIDAIDYDTEKIAQAKEKFAHPNLNYFVQDVTHFNPKSKYDVVLLSNVLEHLHSRPDFLRKIAKQTGAKRLLIRVPSLERDWRVPLKKELGLESRLDLDHKIEYTLSDFDKETRAAGLKVTHLEMRWGEIWSELRPVTKK